MNKSIILVVPAFLALGLSAQPVESEVDIPLDLSKRWSFYRDENIYLQHRCSVQRARSIALIAEKFFSKAENYLGQRELILPLHLRIYADAEEYRRTLRFSRYRKAHYNPRLLIVTAHCEISATLLEEQLALFWLTDAGLRTWQRLLLAETLPRWEKLNRFRLRIINPTKKRTPLLHVLLSDHTPEPEEWQTLAEFVTQLMARGKLKDFLTKLYRERDADDTGLDALEFIFPGITRDLLNLRQPDLACYNSP